MNYKINISSSAKKVLKILKNNGFEGFVVGGCVRDSLLKKEPMDWDITTNALPEEIISIFDKTIPTGLKHGTITVIVDNEPFEVTTYRIDGDYIDNRRPSKVQFVRNIKEDLSRRDFTINAMAYNDEVGLIDFYNGIDDLNNKIIRSVGEAEKRFSEDALRMMRAVRFAAQLNFEIEEKTKKAIVILSNNLKNVSIERIRVEFDKLILADSSYLFILNELGLLKVFLPEVCTIVSTNNIDSIKYVKSFLHLKLSILLYSSNIVSNDEIEKILKRMRYDNKTINKVKIIINYINYKLDNIISIKKVLSNIGEELFLDLLFVKSAYLNRDKSNTPNSYITEIYNNYNKIIKDKQCFSINQLDINGKDILQLGIYKGKEVGDVLNYLLDKVIYNPELNNKKDLLKIAENIERN